MRYRLHRPGTKIRDGVPRWYGGAESCAAIVAAWNSGAREDIFPPVKGEVSGTWDCWIITEDRGLTGAQILAVAGTLSAIVGVIGGFFGSAQVIGVASAIMLAGNVLAYNAERKRK